MINNNRLNLLPKGLRFTSYHFSTKTGPNGHATLTSLLDLMSIPDNVLDAIKLLGGQRMRANIDLIFKLLPVIRQILPEFFFHKKVGTRGFLCSGVISDFPDRENKVRVIAIGDYFSQTVLKPLHKYLFNVLKKIPQDCTFDQSAFLKTIGQSKEPILSADLSAATDRFPISVIEMVLSGRLPK